MAVASCAHRDTAVAAAATRGRATTTSPTTTATADDDDSRRAFTEHLASGWPSRLDDTMRTLIALAVGIIDRSHDDDDDGRRARARASARPPARPLAHLLARSIIPVFARALDSSTDQPIQRADERADVYDSRSPQAADATAISGASMWPSRQRAHTHAHTLAMAMSIKDSPSSSVGPRNRRRRRSAFNQSSACGRFVIPLESGGCRQKPSLHVLDLNRRRSSSSVAARSTIAVGMHVETLDDDGDDDKADKMAVGWPLRRLARPQSQPVTTSAAANLARWTAAGSIARARARPRCRHPSPLAARRSS